MSSDMLINRFEGDMHSTKYKVIVDGNLDNNILVFQPEPLDVYVFRNNTYNIIGSGEFVNKLTVYLGKDLIAYVKRSKGEI